jgi:hypothetical protein
LENGCKKRLQETAAKTVFFLIDYKQAMICQDRLWTKEVVACV